MSAEVIILPDVELLVRNFLIAQPETVAITDTRWYSELPKTKAFPVGRVHQFNSLRSTTRARWLSTSVLQIEAYGGPKATAKLLAETAAGVIEARLPGVHDEGVVTGVVTYGMRDEPDTEFAPAQPRWLFIAEITAHP